MSSRLESHPKWINPCGIGVVVGGSGPTTEFSQISERELILHIINQAQIALSKALQFKDRFVERTFNNPNTQGIQDRFQDQDYDWLPTKNLPKKLGQPIFDPTYLENLKLEPTLKDIYQQLQMIAVGLEQMVWDEEDRNGPFKASFTEAEGYLRTLLCEIQMALIELNYTQHPDISRDIMGEDFRNMDNTNTNIRNWIIYRDYMNMLEYVLEVFQHFEKTVS